MSCLSGLYQHADWKTEKHVPVIEAPDEVTAGESCKITVSVGKEIPHPNKTEHHIRWIEVYFKANDAKFPVQLGRIEFCAHGESVEGPDKSGIYTNHCAAICFKTEKSGTLSAAAYCNIHGLWESSKELSVK
ncbi:MAG: class II SORL domain-containing protein [Victivallaceae bacterium]|jgi:superoxide reductase